MSKEQRAKSKEQRAKEYLAAVKYLFDLVLERRMSLLLGNIPGVRSKTFALYSLLIALLFGGKSV
jgi:hypothetical protein